MPRIKFALFCYFSFFFSINYLNLTFRGQKKLSLSKEHLIQRNHLAGERRCKIFLRCTGRWAIVPEYASSFHEKTYAFVSSYKTSKESSKRSIQLQTGKVFFMIFSINSFHSIMSTSKKRRLRLTMIDVLIYYLLVWKPIEPIVGLIGSTYEKTATCFLSCYINFSHVFPINYLTAYFLY